MREVITKVYKFHELSDDAKEKARTWFREGLGYDQWWDFVFEDAATIGKILGIDLNQKPVKLMNGETRYDPAIYFSGFSSQGDGACFEGSYTYAKGAFSKIKKHAPKDTELARLAKSLHALQKANGYALNASVKQSGRYSHAFSTTIDISRGDDDAGPEVTEQLADLLRDFMNWIYQRLESEWEYMNSDEQVDENILANEYEFTEDGERA